PAPNQDSSTSRLPTPKGTGTNNALATPHSSVQYMTRSGSVLMQGRIAFTAGLWGDAAVVCRAVEGQPGPDVDPQFGVFDTWTHANDFAANLNHGLDVDPLEARQIVTSAILARAHLLQATGCLDIVCTDAPVLIVANALQVRLLLAHLVLALTFCRLART